MSLRMQTRLADAQDVGASWAQSPTLTIPRANLIRNVFTSTQLPVARSPTFAGLTLDVGEMLQLALEELP